MQPALLLNALVRRSLRDAHATLDKCAKDVGGCDRADLPTERAYGSFSRSFTLPEGVDGESVGALFLSNVLIAADGQPMLLDFHLAREPLVPDQAPERLGGPPHHASPEQRAAIEAVRSGGPIGLEVDGRSDVYLLGLLLYEALGGDLASGAVAGAAARRPLQLLLSP